MSVKQLISGLSGAGKTSLTRNLENSLVIYHDGKSYPYPTPHTTVNTFEDVDSFIDTISEKVEAYHEKFKEYPSTIVFDSVSKIFDTISDNCNRKYNNFDIYTNLNREINKFTSFIQDSLIASDMNVILVSHAVYDPETSRYNLVASGSFAKRGGFYAEVDEAIFIEQKSNKRTIHFRSGKFPARTLEESLPDTIDVNDFNLQDHINTLLSNADSIADNEL